MLLSVVDSLISLVSYPKLKIIAVTFLLTYFSIGMNNEYVDPKIYRTGIEWYPVFSWDLFSWVPNERSEYHMEIIQIGGITYNPPLAFRDTEEMFIDLGTSPTEYTPTIFKLGEAIIRDTSKIAEHSDYLASVFAGQRYRYRIYAVTFNPVDYWKHGTYIDKVFIGEFATK